MCGSLRGLADGRLSPFLFGRRFPLSRNLLRARRTETGNLASSTLYKGNAAFNVYPVEYYLRDSCSDVVRKPKVILVGEKLPTQSG